jgi:hypothetical protein
MSLEEIDELGKKLENDVKAVKQELIKICWWMRGGISLNEAAQLTYNDRATIAELVKENLETTNRTNLPFF